MPLGKGWLFSELADKAPYAIRCSAKHLLRNLQTIDFLDTGLRPLVSGEI